MNKAVLDALMQGRTLDEMIRDAHANLRAIATRPKIPLRVIRDGGRVTVELYPDYSRAAAALTPLRPVSPACAAPPSGWYQCLRHRLFPTRRTRP